MPFTSLFKNKPPAAPAPTVNQVPPGGDPSMPWLAPLDGPAPTGYERVGNQWSKITTVPGLQENAPAVAPTATTTPNDAVPAVEDVGPASGWTGPLDTGAPATAAPAAPAATGAPPATIQGAYENALMGLLTGGSPQEAGRDVWNSPAVTAFNASVKRQEARDRQMLAERDAARGFSGSGGFEAGVLGLRARGNEAMNRFAGEQAAQSEAGRRQELLQAMALAASMGDSAAARALERELGFGSQSVQRYGIDRSSEAERYGVDAANQRAQDTLGFNYADLIQRMNSDALRQELDYRP